MGVAAGGLIPTETHHHPLGLLQHQGHITGHTREVGKVVQCGADVLGPSAQGTPQALHLPEMVVTILG